MCPRSGIQNGAATSMGDLHERFFGTSSYESLPRMHYCRLVISSPTIFFKRKNSISPDYKPCIDDYAENGGPGEV